jgi:hypothetical protein
MRCTPRQVAWPSWPCSERVIFGRLSLPHMGRRSAIANCRCLVPSEPATQVTVLLINNLLAFNE